MNVFLVRHLCRVLKLSAREYLWQGTLAPLLAGFLPLATGLSIRATMDLESWSALFLAGAAMFGPFVCLGLWYEIGWERLWRVAGPRLGWSLSGSGETA
jgi:hypothetical protein